LLGISGIWHGEKEWKDVTVDLGFLVSNDGVSFRQPAYEGVFLKRGKDGEWDQGGLLQGQGFENVEEQTYVYYGAWDPRNFQSSPPRGGVGIATVPRDRFGSLSVDLTTKGKGNYQMDETVSSFITGPVDLKKSGANSFYLNADGLGDDAVLKVEILSHTTAPLKKFSGKNAAIVKKDGFQTSVEWDGQNKLKGLPDRVRLRVTFEGTKKTDLALHAIYVK
jgi:hypothetical protein